MQKQAITENEKQSKLRDILKDARTAFMVTRTSTGEMRGRPMACAKVEDDLSALWFVSDRNSGKVAEVLTDNEVCLGCTNLSGSEWASVSGVARIVEDRAKVKELWSAFWKNWFDGPDDPRITLIAVTPHSAEYWDSGSQVLAFLKLAVAAATGKKFNEGENEKVEMK